VHGLVYVGGRILLRFDVSCDNRTVLTAADCDAAFVVVLDKSDNGFPWESCLDTDDGVFSKLLSRFVLVLVGAAAVVVVVSAAVATVVVACNNFDTLFVSCFAHLLVFQKLVFRSIRAFFAARAAADTISNDDDDDDASPLLTLLVLAAPYYSFSYCTSVSFIFDSIVLTVPFKRVVSYRHHQRRGRFRRSLPL
jgi:hypothetical protein